MKSFTREEQETLESAFREGSVLLCPTCGVPLDRREVRASPAVSYVRDRVVVTCPSCHGHMVLDRAEER